MQTESESRRPPSFLALEWIAKNTFCFWSVGGDGVEDVDQHQEQSDKKGLGGKTFFFKLTLNGITKNEQKGPFLFLKSLKSDL